LRAGAQTGFARLHHYGNRPGDVDLCRNYQTSTANDVS
jgi:hypothetical protein